MPPNPNAPNVLNTLCFSQENALRKQQHSQNKAKEVMEMNTPSPNPLSVIHTRTVPEENTNTTITLPGITTPSDAPTTPAMNLATDLMPTQEMDCLFKVIEAEKKLCCTHAPKSAFMIDWRRMKSTQDWNTIVLIDCERLKILLSNQSPMITMMRKPMTIYL